MTWLQEKLLQSKAAFKFIALGSQVISDANQHETWSKFPERQVLLDLSSPNKSPESSSFLGIGISPSSANFSKMAFILCMISRVLR
jgi:hypothetical protein